MTPSSPRNRLTPRPQNRHRELPLHGGRVRPALAGRRVRGRTVEAALPHRHGAPPADIAEALRLALLPADKATN